jgi:hypothetical protein
MRVSIGTTALTVRKTTLTDQSSLVVKYNFELFGIDLFFPMFVEQPHVLSSLHGRFAAQR